MMADLDVITFGETMIRLNPPGFERLERAESLVLKVGGSESNTALALARLGRRVSWFSKLPDDPLGRRIAGEVRRGGVKISQVIWTNSGRVGIYFLESGPPPRSYQVFYDRAGSVSSTLSPEDVD